jgi:hypothetical protein
MDIIFLLRIDLHLAIIALMDDNDIVFKIIVVGQTRILNVTQMSASRQCYSSISKESSQHNIM